MSEQTFVDPEKVVRGAEVLRGAIALAALPELADRLAGTDGAVRWTLSGDRDLFERPRMQLTLEADLVLHCQRCLGPLPHRLAHAWALVVVREEADLPELEEEDEQADCILVPGLLDVRALVVEEMLLALPMMPRHEEADCHGPEDVGGSAKVSPFAVLRQSGGS